MLIPGIHIKAALQFRAKEDVRHYLNGICFRSGVGHTVATDGHRLIVCERLPLSDLNAYEQDLTLAMDTYRIPKELAPETWHGDEKNFPNGELILDIPINFKVGEVVDVRADGTMINYKRDKKLNRLSVEGVYKFKRHDGRYPNYEKLAFPEKPITDRKPKGAPRLNAEYLAVFAKFSPKYEGPKIYIGDEGEPVYFRFTPPGECPEKAGTIYHAITALIMPISR